MCNNCVSSLHNLGVLYGNRGKLAKAKALLSDTSRKGSQESTLELEATNRRGEDNM